MHKYVQLDYGIETLQDEYEVTLEGLNRDLVYDFSEGHARKNIEKDLKILNGVIESMEEEALQGKASAALALSKLLDDRQSLSSVKATIISYYERDLIKKAMNIKP